MKILIGLTFVFMFLASDINAQENPNAKKGQTQKNIKTEEVKRDSSRQDPQKVQMRKINTEFREEMRNIQNNDTLSHEEKRAEMQLLQEKRKQTLEEQGMKGPDQKQDRKNERNQGGQAWSQLAKDLDLNDEQTKKVKEIDRNYRTQLKAVELDQKISKEERVQKINEHRRQRNNDILSVLNDEQKLKYLDHRRFQHREDK
jgi:hypothetical protein